MQDNQRNIYRIARQVSGLTQERWAEAIGVSDASVRAYEAGNQMPSDEVVTAMIEISGHSALGYWHLQNKSRIASELLPELDQIPLPQAVLQLICRIRDFANHHAGDKLMDIASDGVIDDLEREEFDAIVSELNALVQAALQLKYSEGASPERR